MRDERGATAVEYAILASLIAVVIIVAVTAFFGIGTSIAVVVFAMKYRTNDPLAVGARIHGSIPLEIFWSVIPFIISVAIFAWATVVFFDIYRPPDQSLEIYATGKRWMWRFQHTNGLREINTLHVPLGGATVRVQGAVDCCRRRSCRPLCRGGAAAARR